MSEPLPPRAWLLERHAHRTAELDARRRAALAPLMTAEAPTGDWRAFAAEIFRPHRRLWRSLAAVWLALLLFHFTLGRPPRPTPGPPPAPESVIAWFHQFQSHETLAQVAR